MTRSASSGSLRSSGLARRALPALLACLVGAGAMATAAAAAESSPAPATDASGLLGASAEVYRDAFETAADWVDLGSDETGATLLQDGGLSMSIGGDANYIDWLELDEPVAVVRVEALVDIDDADGTGAGVACGSSLGLPRWFVAGVNGADEWFFARQIDGRLQVVDRGFVMLPSTPSRDPVRVAIECATVPEEGGDRVAISVDGRPVTVEMALGRLDIPVGPFSRAGLIVASGEGTSSALFDDMLVHTGDVFAPASSDRQDAVSE